MKAAVSLSLLLFSLSALAQDAKPGYDYLYQLDKAEKTFQAISKDGRAEEVAGRLSGSMQQLATQRSFSGDVDGAIATMDELAGYSRGSALPENKASDEPDLLANANVEAAIDAIVLEARTRNVVILNEAHHVPMHRAFAMQLARALRKIGYSYLACETFGELEPVRDGYALSSTGYYSNEPMYGQFLRDAASDGWKFIAYEPFEENQTRLQREIGEARNLIERIFARDSAAKVFVYVGYSHALKKPEATNDKDFAWMAAQLVRLHKAKILSIDQTTMFSHSQKNFEAQGYRSAVERAGLKQPFVIKSANGSYQVFGKYKGGMDMQVFHLPAVTLPNGRASWLQTMANRTPHDIPPELLPKQGRRLIMAYYTDDKADAVPADVVLAEAGKTAPPLMLPAGTFRYRHQDI